VSDVRRARDPEGQARWVWSGGGVFRDLTAGGLGDGLDELARALADEDGWRARCAAAPEVAASTWPLLCPGRPGKALCLGKNFAAHAREMGSEPPSELVFFAKSPDVLIGPEEVVRIPAWLESRVDPEAEVVVLLGRDLDACTPAEAEEALVAMTLGNDITARGQQAADKERGWPWLRSKNLATFGALGPGWTPWRELSDWQDRRLEGLVNGELQQEGWLADLIWKPVPALVELSRWTPLKAGDIVFLGTPAGVGGVAAGDRLEVRLDGLGALRNPVVRG
jgi:2-keto-4-pentenoate hydratase/2-oxohepta-3-ene-1,7-dioic acid hydratase in catechol pathway